MDGLTTLSQTFGNKLNIGDEPGEKKNLINVRLTATSMSLNWQNS
jgi:hypothetical protein